MKRTRILCWIFLSGTLFARYARSAETGWHADPVAGLLIALVVILAAAKLGSELFERLGQPAVLGELIAGVVLGNLVLVDPSWGFFEPLRMPEITEPWALEIDSLSRLGVLILLFEVGLESSLKMMVSVGASASLVAVLGVIAPFILGYGASAIFIKTLPAELAAVVPADFSLGYVHMFTGAVLCATSVGITARVFKDLGKLQTREAQIILGAAVIDDVLGLIVLALVSGIVGAAETGQAMDVAGLLGLIAKALGFLGGALLVGSYLVPRVMKQLARLRTAGVMLISAVLFAFLLSYLAIAAGLAGIVGAFAAGLLLEKVHFQDFREELTIEKLIKPIADLLTPLFFVLMGIQVHLETFTQWSVLGVAAALTLAAVIGKQVCGLGVLEKGVDRLTIGLGMIPRGEVGLIFAGIGRGLRVLDAAIFSAVVIMVIVTTLITPPVLKLALARSEKPQGGHGSPRSRPESVK